jgi:4-amino-4-deoxy-L-arabinose transferase-like glycosyltransferase
VTEAAATTAAARAATTATAGATATSMTERHFRRGLVAITAIGAAWRLGYLLVAKLHAPLLLNDSLYFSIQAGRNSEGDWFREGLTALPGAEHGPLTSLYLTPWSLGSGPNVEWQRFAMTLLGIATVAVIGLVGRRLAGPVVGLVAAGIAAIYPNLWINDSLVMSESLAVLLVALALLVALDLDRRPSGGRAVLLGAIVGLATLTRSELALLAVGFAGLVWWRAGGRPRRWAAPALVLVATAVTLVPWVVYNAGRFDRTVLLSTNDGTTLLGANCPQTYFVDVGGWDIRCLQPVPNEDTLDPSVRAAERRSIAEQYVRDHLGRVPLVVAGRVGRSLDVYGLGSLVALDRGEEKAGWAVWAGIVCWWVLAIAAVLGWRRLGRGADTRRTRWWLAVPVLTALVTTIAFYGAHRIRAPAEPAVVVLAAVALVAGWERIRARRMAHSPA